MVLGNSLSRLAHRAASNCTPPSCRNTLPSNHYDSNRLVRRLRAPLHDEQLALLAERTHPELQDCLSTAIELRGSKERSTLSTIDVTLLDRTTSIALLLSSKWIYLASSGTHLLRKAGLSGFSIGTMAAVLVLLPTIRETWVNRMLLLSDTPWPRQVTLSIAGFPNGVRRVPRGVDVEILVTAQSTGQIPKVVELQYRGKEDGQLTAWELAALQKKKGSCLRIL